MKKRKLLTTMAMILAITVGMNAQQIVTFPYNPDAPAGTETPFEGWGDVQWPLEVDALDSSPEASDVSAYYQACYDATNLYFYFNVTDNVLVDVNPESSWNGDAIELAISLDDASFNLFWSGDSNDDGKLTFTFTDDAALVESRLLEMSGFASNGGTIDTRTSETSYEIALKVPIASIGDVVTDLTTLEYIRVEVVVNDRDEEVDARKNMISWSGTSNPNLDVSGFGKVFLGKFADDPVLGHSMNYTTLFPANWEIIEFGDGNLGFGMNTSAVDPIHSSGNPWYDPDGPDGPAGNGSGSGLGDYATYSEIYSDVKLTAKIAKPDYDSENDYWDCGIIWGMVDDTKYNYINLSTTDKNSCAAAVVDNEGLRGANYPIVVNHNLGMFDDTLFHEIELMRVGSMVILKYEGNPVMSMDASEYSAAGMVGLGSWNDGVIFDDVAIESITEFGASTDVSYTTSVGTLVNDTIEGIETGTTVQNLLDGLSLASGATAIVVETITDESDAFWGFSLKVDGSAEITNTMRLLVTSEAGYMEESGLKISSLSSDVSIAAYFTPLTYDEETSTISTIEGTTLSYFLGLIRPQESATEAVLDADLNEVTDGDALIVDGMFYRVTAEDGTIKDYPITTYPPDYPTWSAYKVDDDHPVTIDAWFDEWVDYGEGIAIETLDPDDETLVQPSSDADLSMKVKMAWDEDYLYVYFYVQDDINTVDPDLNSWNNDGIELATVMTSEISGRSGYNMFWSTETQPGNMKLLFNPDATLATAVAGGLNTGSSMRDFTGAIMETWELEDGNTGYEVEIQFPWTTLNGIDNDNPFVVAESNSFSMNIAINDNDGGDDRETIFYGVVSNMNMDASDYPLVKLVPFGGSSSVQDMEKDQMVIYPNPATDFITLSGIETASHIEIYNTEGKLILRTEYDSQNEMNLNVSSLNSGLYLIRVMNEDQSIATGRFNKQ